MDEFDVVVVGAGPAGNRAAISSAKSGANTLLLEEHPIIGRPVACGEGISRAALDSFGLPAEDAEYFNRPVKEFRMFAPNGTVVKLRIDGFIIDREKFDQYNAKIAKEMGADVRTSYRVENVVRENGGLVADVLVKNSKKTRIKTKIIIDATGPSARIGKRLGAQTPDKYVFGVEYKLKGITTSSFDFYLDFKKYKNGYVWIFPKGDDHANVGIVTTNPMPKKILNEFIREKEIEGEILKHIAGAIPMTGPLEMPVSDNFLSAGDAAGTTNALFYGGIRAALISGDLAGKIAGKAIKEGNVSKERLAEYAKLLHEQPIADKNVLLAQKIFYGFDNETYNHFSKILNNKYLDSLGISGYLKAGYIGFLDKKGRKMRKELWTMIKGFKTTANWGF